MPPIIAGFIDGRITFLIAFKSLSPKHFAALNIPTPIDESCILVIKNIYGNKAIDIIIEAPNMFFIEGSIIFKLLKYSDTGLEYSKIPTKIKA